MFCSLFFASVFCFQPAPVVCEPIIYDHKAIVTAYSLEAKQTDGAPCIGAGNHNLCLLSRQSGRKCIIATRMYNLHQLLNIEGIGECEVLDRTSKKYADRIDLLLPSREEAIKFGKQEKRYKEIND